MRVARIESERWPWSAPLISACFVLLVQAARAEETAETLLGQGRQHYARRDYDKALDCFSRAIQAAPADARCHDWRGLVLMHKSQPEQALKHIEKALQLDARLPSAYLHRAYLRLARKEFKEAVSDFSRAIELDANGEVAYYSLCYRAYASFKLTPPEVYAKQGKGTDPPGHADVASALELRPELPDAYFLRGALRNEYLGDTRTAGADYDKAIAIEPTRLDFLNVRAMLRYQMGEPREKVLADLNAAIELDRRYAPPYIACAYDAQLALVYVNRGLVRSDTPKSEQALQDFSEAVRLDPDNVVARLNRGAQLAEFQRYEEAMTDFDRAIKVDPGFWLAYRHRGCLLTDLGRLHEALADFDQCLRLAPKRPEVYNDRGNVYDKKGEKDKALADFTKAISLNPADWRYYLNRGAVYFDLEQYEKAIADFSKTIELAPGYHEGWVNRGLVHMKLGHWHKAIADFSKDVELRHWAADAYARRAAAYEKAGQPERAKGDWRKAKDCDENTLAAGLFEIIYNAKREYDSLKAQREQAKLPPGSISCSDQRE